jgi:hypothetical protein
MKLSGDRWQCARCLRYFNSTHAFDKHRHGQGAARTCRTEAEMEHVGMSVNRAGYWISAKRVNLQRPDDETQAIG